MQYTEKIQKVSVLGAAGKMGSGILLLTAMEMTDLSLQPENRDRHFVLYAIDTSSEALSGLMHYLRAQVHKAAEKKIVALRQWYAHRKDLVQNEHIINQYVQDVLFMVRPSHVLEAAYNSNIVFEAIKEDPRLKVKIFRQIDQNSYTKPWFFTNTSSIPIHLLDEKAELGGRVLGMHFYNPPAVQKLVEIIKTPQTLPELDEFARTLARNLRKTTVPSADFAGFIGNGHFMRDALYGIQQAEKLAAHLTFTEALYMINKVSQDYLIRPMGIFQLIDYVGVDVCSYIMSVMNPWLKDEDLHSALLDKMIEQGVLGGQNYDGSQKNGFLRYEKGRPTGIYNPSTQSYEDMEAIAQRCQPMLGEDPKALKPWKAVVGDARKEEYLKGYFADLKNLQTLGGQLAVEYARNSRNIGLKLVQDKVAFSNEDVNTVLLTGFFHAYGPINDFV
ncbi:MAG: 3-hydroxyacyl-CoA dehydrogenase family protein [Bacteroidales bacterium]